MLSYFLVKYILVHCLDKVAEKLVLSNGGPNKWGGGQEQVLKFNKWGVKINRGSHNLRKALQ